MTARPGGPAECWRRGCRTSLRRRSRLLFHWRRPLVSAWVTTPDCRWTRPSRWGVPPRTGGPPLGRRCRGRGKCGSPAGARKRSSSGERRSPPPGVVPFRARRARRPSGRKAPGSTPRCRGRRTGRGEWRPRPAAAPCPHRGRLPRREWPREGNSGTSCPERRMPGLCSVD